jgi:hypothetical protein
MHELNYADTGSTWLSVAVGDIVCCTSDLFLTSRLDCPQRCRCSLQQSTIETVWLCWLLGLAIEHMNEFKDATMQYFAFDHDLTTHHDLL